MKEVSRMEIKQSYKYFIKENSTNLGIIFLIVVGVNLLTGILILGFTSDIGSVGYLLNKVTPSFSVVTLIMLIYAITTFNSSMLVGNQFGRTRLTVLLANSFSMLTIIVGISLVASIAGITYISSGGLVLSLYKGQVSNGSLFVKEFFWLFTSLINTVAVGTFVMAIWSRIKPIVRLIVFVGIPVVFIMLIPRIILVMRMGTSNFENFLLGLFKFFGYSSSFNGLFNSQLEINVLRNTLTETLLISLPLFILAYFITRKSTYNNKKS
jgi:hypothetical protein